MSNESAETYISVESILEEARARAKLDDFGEADYQAPMDAINAPFAAGESPLRGDASKEASLLAWLRQGMDAMERFDAAHPGRALHLRYDELMAESTQTMQRVHQHAGVPADVALQARIAAFLQKQRTGHRAAPPADYETYGYDHDAVWADEVVARYAGRYGICREQVRVVDVQR